MNASNPRTCRKEGFFQIEENEMLEDLKEWFLDMVETFGEKIIYVFVALLVLVLFLVSCATAAEKPVMAAHSQDGKVSIELYGEECTNTASIELGIFVFNTAPFPIEPNLKSARWLGHADGKNFDGCWQEIPEIDGIFVVFEDGDVKVFQKEMFLRQGYRYAPKIDLI